MGLGITWRCRSWEICQVFIHLPGLVSVGIWEPEEVIALVATLPGQSSRASSGSRWYR